MDLLDVLAILSALLVLTGFIGNEFGKLPSGGLPYDLLNLVGAIGLFSYAYINGLVPYMLTNGVWAIVSGIDVARQFVGHTRLKRKRK